MTSKRKCCYPNCEVQSTRTENKAYFKFPESQNLAKFKSWESFVRQENPTFVLSRAYKFSSSRFLCEQHFDVKYIKTVLTYKGECRKRLDYFAVPSIHLSQILLSPSPVTVIAPVTSNTELPNSHGIVRSSSGPAQSTPLLDHDYCSRPVEAASIVAEEDDSGTGLNLGSSVSSSGSTVIIPYQTEIILTSQIERFAQTDFKEINHCNCVHCKVLICKCCLCRTSQHRSKSVSTQTEHSQITHSSSQTEPKQSSSFSVNSTQTVEPLRAIYTSTPKSNPSSGNKRVIETDDDSPRKRISSTQHSRRVLDMLSISFGTDSEIWEDKNDSDFNPADVTTNSASSLEEDFNEMTVCMDPTKERKFLVFEGKIIELLRVCPSCFERCQISSRTEGSCLVLSVRCLCGYTRNLMMNSDSRIRRWESQPAVISSCGTPFRMGNLQLSSALFLSGNRYSQVRRMFDQAGIQMMSESSFYDHQRDYIQGATYAVWERQRASHFGRLAEATLEKFSSTFDERKIVLAVDGRASVPGQSATMGLATILDVSINKICDMELVHRVESGSSQMMETMGVQRLLERIHANGVMPDVLVSDRSPSVRKLCREMLDPRTQHRFDIWHIAKSLEKKMSKAAKRAAVRDLSDWIKPLVKHLYTCALTTLDGDGDIIVEKWLSSLKHVVGNHEDCFHMIREEHSDLTRYLSRNSETYRVLESFISDARFLSDVRMMSPWGQTYMLESFHALLNRFSPKMINWSFFGHLSRSWLAALHFNENAGREAKRDSEGNPLYILKRPKWKETWFAKLERCDQTYAYGDEIMTEIVRMAREKKTLQLSGLFDKPPTMLDGIERPSVEEVLESRRPRGIVDEQN